MKKNNILENYFPSYFDEINLRLNAINLEDLKSFSELVFDVKKTKNKIIIAGNGGSAAISSHVSVDFTKACGLRAVNFNEADLITCFANDFGYENWLEKALEYYADPEDVLILISSSGQSKNIINAALRAKELGLKLVTFSGFSNSNPLRNLGALNFWVDSRSYNVVEMTHHIWLLAIVDLLSLRSKNL